MYSDKHSIFRVNIPERRHHRIHGRMGEIPNPVVGAAVVVANCPLVMPLGLAARRT